MGVEFTSMLVLLPAMGKGYYTLITKCSHGCVHTRACVSVRVLVSAS